MSKYINPYTDFGFKRLFGTEGNKDLLVDFLNCLMPAKHQITELNFRNVEQPGEIATDRKAFYDIFCQSANGDRFIVEMQKAKVKYFKDRALFYITFPITEQAQRGDWDFKLLPIYYIAILDFPYDEHEEIRKFDRNVQLRDEDGFVFYDKLGFRFLQMPFFNKKEDELVTHYDKWCYFLKHLETFDDIPQILNEPLFDKAFKTAALAAMSQTDRKEYEQSKLVYFELKAVMDTSKEEGLELGLELGIEKGIEKGIELGIEKGIPRGELIKARKIAKEMKVKGYSLDEIAELTNLPKEEIEKL
ncbi:MAG: Rpn family recombination-promoting nuclease/putative transposase [Mariniphaga sp.]